MLLFIIKASTGQVCAQLRKLTALQPVQGSNTHWSSVFTITTRFFCIQKKLSSAIKGFFPLLPTLLRLMFWKRATSTSKNSTNQYDAPEGEITFFKVDKCLTLS
jgi:hypothetical protein